MLSRGGKLPVRQIKKFIEASYDVKNINRFKKFIIEEYELDLELSNKWGRIFYNKKLNKLVVVHRGTASNRDWFNNATIAIDVYELTDRFKTAKILQTKAELKYPGSKVYTLGHSQSGQLTHKLGTNSSNVISLNPAYKLENQRNNEFVIRSSIDPVSVLKSPHNKAMEVMYPGWNRKHNITIQATTNNLLTEHSPAILDRLDGDMMIGRGKLKTFKFKNITYKITI